MVKQETIMTASVPVLLLVIFVELVEIMKPVLNTSVLYLFYEKSLLFVLSQSIMFEFSVTQLGFRTFEVLHVYFSPKYWPNQPNFGTFLTLDTCLKLRYINMSQNRLISPIFWGKNSNAEPRLLRDEVCSSFYKLLLNS